jgi:hypothetical protein
MDRQTFAEGNAQLTANKKIPLTENLNPDREAVRSPKWQNEI